MRFETEWWPIKGIEVQKHLILTSLWWMNGTLSIWGQLLFRSADDVFSLTNFVNGGWNVCRFDDEQNCIIVFVGQDAHKRQCFDDSDDSCVKMSSLNMTHAEIRFISSGQFFTIADLICFRRRNISPHTKSIEYLSRLFVWDFLSRILCKINNSYQFKCSQHKKYQFFFWNAMIMDGSMSVQANLIRTVKRTAVISSKSPLRLNTPLTFVVVDKQNFNHFLCYHLQVTKWFAFTPNQKKIKSSLRNNRRSCDSNSLFPTICN